VDWQRVLLGIGNPGAEYSETRHNAGFMVLDHVANRLGLTFRRLERKTPDGVKRFGGKVKAQAASGETNGTPFLLVKPLTFVNLSGDVAGPLLRVDELTPESLFVVLDDLNLPLGRIRVRPSGSSGGHNGLRSIEAALATAEYPRLRLGIGESVESTVVDHVLAPFRAEEREVLVPSLERAADACIAWLGGEDVPSLMCRFNGTETPPDTPDPTNTDTPGTTDLE
jgi:peptidyl-tRNA hydrolase, PTH1 family